MRVEQLQVVNFCNHRQKVIDFGRGTTAIIGPNGSGKSSIMGAIRFSMTGENPHNGVQIANICDRAPTTENSFTQLVFSHGPVRATVRRNLRPARPTAIMTLESGEVIEGAQDVTARIEQILGISTAVLNEIVIVSQTDILGFIDKSAAKRAELFQRLFNTQSSEMIYKAIGDRLKNVEIPSVGVSKDALTSQLRERQAALDALKGQLAGVATYEVINNAKTQNSAIVTAFHNLQAAYKRLESFNAQQLQTAQSWAQAAETVTKYERDRAVIEEAMNSATADAEQARLLLHTLGTVKLQQQAVDNANSQLDRLRNQRSKYVEPQRPAVYIEDQATAEQQLSLITSTIRQHQQMVDSFANGCVECPTCHTPTDALMTQLEEAKAALQRLKPEQQALSSALHLTKEYVKAHTQWQGVIKSYDDQINLALQHLNNLPPVTTVVGDEATANAAIQQYTTYQEGINEYNNMLVTARAQKDQLSGSCNTLSTQITQLNQEIANMPHYSQEQCDTANEYVRQWDAVATQRRTLETDIAVASNEVRNLEQQIETTERVERDAKGLRAAYQGLDTVRSLFHKDAAPRFVAQQNLQALNVTMNENLHMFGSDFIVQADEGLSFNAHFQNGSVQPAERLSGGQKVILAFAFRLALNMMFAENIGALYLDEPTAWLDETHIRGFEPIMHRLREFSTSRGLQSIIVTHEQRLAPLFDSVIQL